MKVKRAIAVLLVLVLVFAPAAAAAPVNPLCDTNEAYRVQHPLICNPPSRSPLGLTPGGGGGGGGGGGLLGTLGRIVGGLTGGLL